ncbi:MAG: hypothetical protein WA939_15840 [Nodosilinea sp.]
MAPSPFLTSFIRHRDPKLLWPVAGVASVVAHGVALVLVRTLVIQTPALPEGAMAPLPIQLLTLPTDLPAPAEPSASSPDLASSDSASVEPAAAAPPTPVAAQATPISPANSPANTETLRPPLEPFITSAPPQAVAPSVAPAPPVPVAPAPPRPASPASETPAAAPAMPAPGPPAAAPVPEAASGQGGQVVPVGIRLNPNGRDIPDVAPQLLGATAIDMQPLASGCGFANLEALLVGVVDTSVQLQIRVEPSGEISQVRPLQGSGNGAVDDLVSCVVRQRLQLQPASSAGVPQLTDAFILDAQIQF